MCSRFLAHLYECTARVIAMPPAASVVLANGKRFDIKVPYVMGKGLTGNLSCRWTGLLFFISHLMIDIQ